MSKESLHNSTLIGMMKDKELKERLSATRYYVSTKGTTGGFRTPETIKRNKIKKHKRKK